MQIIARRLIVISAIALFGAVAGLKLGQFVAGPEAIGNHGMNEARGFESGFMAAGENMANGRDVTEQPGPTSYSCQGCDAHLYNDMIPGSDVAPADVMPLPPYHSEDAQVAPPTGPERSVQRDVSGVSPRLPELTVPTPILLQPQRPMADQSAALPDG